jgi:hypothetical protein
MRIAGALWTLAFLLWLPFEDTQVGTTAMLAAIGVGWLAFRLPPRHSATWWQVAFWGGLLGLALPLLAISLMAFKSGLHGHGFPDFTVGQVWLALAALPWSGALGLILALGSKIYALGIGQGKAKDRSILE